MEKCVCIFVNSETEKGIEQKKEKLLEYCLIQEDFPVVVLSIRTVGNYLEEEGIRCLLDLVEENIIDMVLVDTVSDITNSPIRLDELLKKLSFHGVTLKTPRSNVDYDEYHNFLCDLGIVREENTPWILRIIRGLGIYDK